MKSKKYLRLKEQIRELLVPVSNPIARMATIVALLHHKMPLFFWTGFYLLEDSELLVGPYQGPLACLKLKKEVGVCWSGINRKEPVLVDDVETFPGHIACSSLSKSEVVIPLKDCLGEVVGVLDVDSKELNAFDDEDVVGLQQIVDLVYNL